MTGRPAGSAHNPPRDGRSLPAQPPMSLSWPAGPV